MHIFVSVSCCSFGGHPQLLFQAVGGGAMLEAAVSSAWDGGNRSIDDHGGVVVRCAPMDDATTYCVQVKKYVACHVCTKAAKAACRCGAR